MRTEQLADQGLPQILIVDSHAADRERLRAQFATLPCRVAVAATSVEAQKRVSASRIDAVVVDPDLPGEDGFSLVRRLAAAPERLVFVVAAGEDDQLPEQAYASGATDFAYKPITSNELLARLRKKMEDQATTAPPAPRVTLRREERVCVVDGSEHNLTRNERSFVGCLVDAPRNFATYRELIAAVWGDGANVETQSLRVLAAQVRRKLEQKGWRPLIRTVVGEGFRLDA